MIKHKQILSNTFVARVSHCKHTVGHLEIMFVVFFSHYSFLKTKNLANAINVVES